MSDLYNNLLEYSSSDYYPFHMPGHKRNVNESVSPFSYDITEIEGFDNLHNPQGILRIAMEEAAKFYEADKTYFLVNGSTCGLLSAICGVTDRGDKVLVARNCHKSVYNAMYLNGLTPVYVLPEYIEEYGINGGILPEKVAVALEDNKDIKAVIITSPTYEGVVSDIRSIADIVHKRKIPLIVDEAHGAHFSMHPKLPKSALMNGADVVIQSVHKTLPSLTQTALLHIKSSIVNIKSIEEYLSIYQTSSPSYVLMSSIDECINKIKTNGMIMFEPYVKRLEVLKNHARQLTHVKLLDSHVIGKSGVYDLDLSKIVISVKGTSHTGRKVYEEMSGRFHLQLEMAANDYVIAMTSPMDTEEGLLRLFTALVEIDRDIRIYGDDKEQNVVIDVRQPQPIVLDSIYNAVGKPYEVLNLENAVGKISCEYIYLYPPGSPILAPGELISAETVRLVREYKRGGLEIMGLEDTQKQNIKVVKEEFRQINLTRGVYSIAGNGD